MNVLNRDDIKTFLPHREPMLLIDDVTMDGDTALAHYHVRGGGFGNSAGKCGGCNQYMEHFGIHEAKLPFLGD